MLKTNVGDHPALVVGVIGLVGHQDTHGTADELDVGREAPEGSEDGGDAELGPVKAFP